MPGLVRRDRLEARGFPCLVRAGADRGGEERLGLGAAEHEVRAVALGALLVGHQLSADDERHRDGAAAGDGLDVDGTLDRIPGALNSDHAVVEVDVRPLEATELAASEPAEQRDSPERLLGVGERREQLVRHLGRFDPVAAAADRGQVEVLGRIESDLVAADRPAEDDPERIEDVGDGGGREGLAPQRVHEVLNVAALQVGQLPSAEGGDDVGVEELFIAAGRRRLVRLPRPVKDRPVVGAFDQDLGRLGDRLRRRRAHRPAAQRDLGILAPQLRGSEGGEGPPHLPACTGVVRLGLVGRLTGAASTLARCAVARVTDADPGSHEDR
ncbi:MAG TPA: hypothetical protein VGL78_17130 [Solirubrobacteraceae bacterium]